MLFFVFLSLVAMFRPPVGAGATVSRGPGCPSPSGGSGIASCASRLCRTHRRASIFVDFNRVASGVCPAREAFEAFRALRDDRVGVGAGFDHVTLFDLLVEECVEAVPARAERIDLTHEPEYRTSGFSADSWRGCDRERQRRTAGWSSRTRGVFAWTSDASMF